MCTSTPAAGDGFTLSVAGISFAYGDTAVWTDANLTVRPGEVVGIVGPNGSGKSTLLGLLSGELTAPRGSIHLGTTDLTRLRSDQRFHQGLTAVPQGSTALFPDLTVEEHLQLATRRFARTERGGRIDAVLKQVGFLLPLRAKKAVFLSGGQRQALSIAVALATDPKVLLFDEPSHGLSVQMRHQVVDWLRGLRSASRAVILAEQFPRLAEAVCDRVYGIAGGALQPALTEHGCAVR